MKYAVLFYCLILSSKYTDKITNQDKIIREMISLLLLGEFWSSPLDEDPKYITQTMSILSFFPPPKKGENIDYVSYAKKSKETKMEDAISCLATLVVFLEFILDDEGTSKIPAIIHIAVGPVVIPQLIK